MKNRQLDIDCICNIKSFAHDEMGWEGCLRILVTTDNKLVLISQVTTNIDQTDWNETWLQQIKNCFSDLSTLMNFKAFSYKEKEVTCLRWHCGIWYIGKGTFIKFWVKHSYLLSVTL